jgi:hypothetical protein
VKCGIDSMSLTADTVLATTLSVLKMEEKLEGKGKEAERLKAKG